MNPYSPLNIRYILKKLYAVEPGVRLENDRKRANWY